MSEPNNPYQFSIAGSYLDTLAAYADPDGSHLQIVLLSPERHYRVGAPAQVMTDDEQILQGVVVRSHASAMFEGRWCVHVRLLGEEWSRGE